jgi:UDP-glucose 4-epimerase
MSVLVTGGAGYIGSHTARALVARGRDVVVVDDLSTGHPEAVLGAPLAPGRVDDAELIADVVARYGVDSVIHFAALKAAGESVVDPVRYFRHNAGATAALLDALTASSVGRFVFSSTAAVYGTPRHLPIDEDDPLHPDNPYGESKLMVERMLPWIEAAFPFRFVSLRYFNAAGASSDGRIGEDFSVTTNLVPLVMKAALRKGHRLQIFGTDYPTPDGTAVRDYVHVEDLAEAHVLALEYLENGGASTVVNLGTGNGSSVMEVVERARAVSRADIPAELVERRPGDPAVLVADNAKAARVLGWKPTRGLTEIVDTAWRWHSTHPDGFNS